MSRRTHSARAAGFSGGQLDAGLSILDHCGRVAGNRGQHRLAACHVVQDLVRDGDRETADHPGGGPAGRRPGRTGAAFRGWEPPEEADAGQPRGGGGPFEARPVPRRRPRSRTGRLQAAAGLLSRRVSRPCASPMFPANITLKCPARPSSAASAGSGGRGRYASVSAQFGTIAYLGGRHTLAQQVLSEAGGDDHNRRSPPVDPPGKRVDQVERPSDCSTCRWPPAFRARGPAPGTQRARGHSRLNHQAGSPTVSGG